jgi:hypothetical protein
MTARTYKCRGFSRCLQGLSRLDRQISPCSLILWDQPPVQHLHDFDFLPLPKQTPTLASVSQDSTLQHNMTSKGRYNSIPRTASESDNDEIGNFNNSALEAEDSLVESLKSTSINEIRRLRKSVRWLQLSSALSTLVSVLLFGLLSYRLVLSPKPSHEDWSVTTSTGADGSSVRKAPARS